MSIISLIAAAVFIGYGGRPIVPISSGKLKLTSADHTTS